MVWGIYFLRTSKNILVSIREMLFLRFLMFTVTLFGQSPIKLDLGLDITGIPPYTSPLAHKILVYTTMFDSVRGV